MNKKGFVNIVPIIILFVVFAGTAGYFALNNLKKEAWVRVTVVLNGNEFTSPKFQEDLNKKKLEIQKIQNAVLADLTKNDFKIIWKLENSLIFTGKISKSGMDKLNKDSRVKSISLDSEVHAM